VVAWHGGVGDCCRGGSRRRRWLAGGEEERAAAVATQLRQRAARERQARAGKLGEEARGWGSCEDEEASRTAMARRKSANRVRRRRRKRVRMKERGRARTVFMRGLDPLDAR
jgi:hypothetical protein